MADFSDDYVIVGAPSDNFDCDATGGWTEGGNGSAVSTNSNNPVEGSAFLELTASDTGDSYWYHDISPGSRFKITEKDLHFWFSYVKGKGANYLVQNSTAVVIRLYFGGTTKYADYRCTESGDLELKFGWQLLSASGKNLRGGSVGGGHNGGSDYDLDVYRIELHLNFANKNDTPLGMDCWFVGTKVKVTSGTSSDPATFSDIEEYSNKDRSAFPLGLIYSQQRLVNVKCGLEIGDGSSGSGHQGYLKDDSKFILFNQLSTEVKHHFLVKNYSTVILGRAESGSSETYYTHGCQLVLPASRYSDLSVENGGTLKLYDSKLYRWRYVYLGASSDTGSTVELYNVDIDSCETVYFRANTMNVKNVHIHDNAQQVNTYASVVTKQIDTMDVMKVYKCNVGVYAQDNLTFNTLYLTDNTKDMRVSDSKTVQLRDSVVHSSKMEVG